MTKSAPELSIDDVRDRLESTIHTAFEQDGSTLVEALPAMGKSYHAIKWAETTGKHLSVFTSRRELYGQYEQWCINRELDFHVLPAFHHLCDTMGEGYSIENDVSEVYDAGISGAEIHRKSKQYFGSKLPCQHDGPCQYMDAREFNPEDYDVLIGHYLQAHNRDYLEDRYVAIDEFPSDAYFFDPTHNEATRAVSNYLKAEDNLPFENWKDLRYRRHKDEYEDTVEEWKDELGFYSHRDTRVQLQQNPGFHAHAPLLTHAGLEFELLGNEWEYAELGSGRKAVRSPEDEWTVLIPPPFYAAESVVALDGTPMINKWRLVLGGDWVNHETVLEDDQEKRTYLSEVLGLRIIQTDAGTKPYESGVHVNTQSDGALLESVPEREGTRPAVITSKTAKEIYRSSGLDDYIERIGHYGDLKGSNDFADTDLAIVIGSPHPPENEAVERWAAFDGESVERATDEDGQDLRGVDLDLGPLGNALFQDVVQYEVLQAVMRFGRTPDKPVHGATVYVHTSRLPEWVNPETYLEVTTWSNGMQEVVETIKSSKKWPNGEWTNKEIAEGISIGKKQVCDLMKELDEEGYVSHCRAGRGNAYHWSNVKLESLAEYGEVV
ncbi:hypothetical protein NDI54_07165 [Haloarcula sp. S1AR25-5A]|uniref:Uncharacterized protein n=1 Tax=Haloarcula terrestris TaxID=2950533 RepID=A0AAE4EW87_9EURY|nr:hypothetical protein [Haloarcula terrestris]MDS0221123.1 hypothetical protein [Haloarcula terrestris]